LYLFETALILDAALRDFEHDRDQKSLQEQANNHNNDTNATNNQSDEPPDTDPSRLHEQIDSYLAETVLILDAALHDFRHAVDQQPLYEHTNGHNTESPHPPTNKTKVQSPAHMHPRQSPNQPTQKVSQHHSDASNNR
jgi:hypothetical protein